MSETLAVCATNVRSLIHEDDPANYAVDTISLYHLIVQKAQELQHPITTGLTNTTSAFTYSIGSTADYTLPTGVGYQSVVTLWVPSLGRELHRRSISEINLMRIGITSSTASQGEPNFYAIWESGAQVVTVRLDVVPSVGRAVDVLHAQTVPTTYTDATAIAMRDQMLRIIEKSVALDVLLTMAPEQREERNLNPDVVKMWDRDVSIGRVRAMEAAHRMTVASHYLGGVSF